ncbi:hypothetical protein KKF45_05715 [Patescibacteria group bacterium]|nr:hypothetical protein [Patescibacteria group bacterium]
MNKESAILALAALLPTLVESDIPFKHTAPQTFVYLGLRAAGVLQDLDDWYWLLGLARKMGYVTHTSETVTLTEAGVEIANQLNAILST